jgi:hypothetical protein
MSVYEDLKILEKRISEEGYEINRFEIRERKSNYRRNNEGRPAQRAVGRDPLKVFEEWSNLDGEDYFIEVFLSGRHMLDRIIYDSVEETTEYIEFSGKKPSIEELLEE